MKARRWNWLLTALTLVVVLAPTAVWISGQSAAPAAAVEKPIPRLSDGKPDFSGVWDRPRATDVTRDSNDCGSGDPRIKGCKQKGSGTLTYTAWGEEQWRGKKYDYAARCLPWGYTRAMQTAYPIEVIHTTKRMAYLFESNNVFHVFSTDGRKLPEKPDPTWLGVSSARFEGDTLVIETAGFNGLTWLDTAEHPSSDALKVTERLRYLDADHIEYEVTWDDPKTYTKPFKNTRVWVRMLPGTELMEWWCMENNKDLLEGHLEKAAK